MFHSGSASFQPVEEPEKMTEIIVRALEITGQRGIINKGWGGLGDCMLLHVSAINNFLICQLLISFVNMNRQMDKI